MSSSREQTPNESPRSIDLFLDEAYESSGSKCGRFRYWLMFLALGIANMGDAAELAAMGYLIANEGFQDIILHDDMKHYGATISSVVIVGLILGGLAAGSLEHGLGRKPSLLIGLGINSSSCLASVFAPGVVTFAVARFSAGFGIGFIVSSIMTLAAELSPPSNRGLFVAFVSSFWSVGVLFVALVGFLVLGVYKISWRIFLCLCAMPSVVSFVLVVYSVPESARFLALRGKYAEAVSRANMVAERMGTGCKRLKVEEVHHLYSQKKDAHSKEKERSENENFEEQEQSAVPMQSEDFRSKIVTNFAGLFSKELRKGTIGLVAIWILLEGASGLGAWINTIFVEAGANQYLGSFFVAVGNGVGHAGGAVLVDRVGRKSLVIGGQFLAAISLALFAWLVHDDRDHTLALVMSACCYAAVASSAWTGNLVLTSEYFPTNMRSAGFGVCAGFGRLSCIFAQFVNGALVDQPALLLTIASATLFAGMLTTFTLEAEDMSQKPLADKILTGETRNYNLVPIHQESDDVTVATEATVAEEMHVPSLV